MCIKRRAYDREEYVLGSDLIDFDEFCNETMVTIDLLFLQVLKLSTNDAMIFVKIIPAESSGSIQARRKGSCSGRATTQKIPCLQIKITT